MKTFRIVMAAAAFIALIASPVMATITPTPVSAACDARFLGIPPWYRGITEGDDCKIKSPGKGEDGITKFITKIALNIIEMIMVITAYIASFFILYGGYLFIANNGTASVVEKASRTILNAVIGLVISLVAVGLVNFIFGLIQ